MYKLTTNPYGEPTCIIRLDDGGCIPINEANTDYQAYLKWLDESTDNVPLPADE